MNSQDYRNLQEAYIGVYDDDIREKLEFESWVNSLIEEGYDLSDYTWDELYENYTQLDEAIRNLESRKKLLSIMDREVVKGDKSKGQNPRMKYHTKKGDQAFDLLIKRDETGSKGNPVRSRGGMADSVGPTRDRGAGNKAARRIGKSVPNTRDVDESYDQQLDEISDRKVAAVGKRREKDVSKAFDNYADVSEKPGGTQKLATDISKLNRFKNLEKKRDRRINKESYDQQLDEISQKTATRAFAQRATNEFETDQTSKKSDATKSRIEKKFGKKAGAHAERAAHANIFGRKSSSMPKESYDLYDIILSHLLDEGYAETPEAAERIMVNMSEDWRESIVETRMDPRGRPASGPMNVYANPKGKPSQAHLDAVKSYEDEQRKKTPEQRKKELDDYRERQMNNK